MSEFTLHRFAGPEALRGLLPRCWRSQFKWGEFTPSGTAILVFGRRYKDLVTSQAIQQAFALVGDLTESRKVAIGRHFTSEAAQLLTGAGYEVYSSDNPPPVQGPRRRLSFDRLPHSVLYISPACPGGRTIYDWYTVNYLLGRLHPQKCHLAIFELPDQSYVQCLGRKMALTVESRVYHPDGTYTHWVFGKGDLTGRTTQVGGPPGMVTIDASQILQLRDARLIIRQFLETRTFPAKYRRNDVTARYSDPGPEASQEPLDS